MPWRTWLNLCWAETVVPSTSKTPQQCITGVSSSASSASNMWAQTVIHSFSLSIHFHRGVFVFFQLHNFSLRIDVHTVLVDARTLLFISCLLYQRQFIVWRDGANPTLVRHIIT